MRNSKNCRKSGPFRVRYLPTVIVGLFSLREKAPTKNYPLFLKGTWTFSIISNTQYSFKRLWSLSTPYKSLICELSTKSYDWNSSESKGKEPKPTPFTAHAAVFLMAHKAEISSSIYYSFAESFACILMRNVIVVQGASHLVDKIEHQSFLTNI